MKTFTTWNPKASDLWDTAQDIKMQIMADKREYQMSAQGIRAKGEAQKYKPVDPFSNKTGFKVLALGLGWE